MGFNLTKMNSKLIIVLLLLAPFSTMAQERRYVDKQGATTTAESAIWYETVAFSSDSVHKTVRRYSMNDWVMGEDVLLASTLVRDGKCQWFNPDGSVQWYRNYKNGKEEGDSRTFYESGKIKREELFSNGTLVSGKCFDEQGIEVPYFPMERRPEFPGGMQEAYKYIGNNFRVKGSATGSILVTFVVEKDGSIVEVEVKKGLNKRMDQEAIRVVESMPKWIPGQQDGKPVRCVFALPIKIAR